MNISKYRKLALVLPLTLMLGACDKEFEDINTNPNVAEAATPNYLLTNAIKVSVDRYMGVEANMDGGSIIVQHWAKIQYPDEDAYFFRTTTYQNIWTGFYSQGLEDFNNIIALGKAQENPNYQAAGMIMRAWVFSLLTDMYGDIPYSEALRIREGITVPKYDAQQDVYKGLLAELKAASAMIDVNGHAIGGDILYEGDMSQWKKFANSLRLRLAMRIADADEATARTNVQEVLAAANAANLFQSNADNAQLNYLSSAPSNNPINENRKTRDDHRVSKTLVTKLQDLKDPRLAIYADKAKDTGLYTGVQNGLSADDANALGLSKTSKVGSYFTAAQAPGVIMTYSEVLFFKAEAIARGFITGNAETVYNEAITASMQQYGISKDEITAYLAQSAVKYNAADYRKSIGEQKWIALFGQGLEAWSEYRRLDYPQLTPGPEAVLAKPPVRFIYPGNEQSVNTNSYKEAVARQGADALTTKLWWDKR